MRNECVAYQASELSVWPLLVTDGSIGVAGQGTVIVSDINEAMLEEGKKRAKHLGAALFGRHGS